MRASDLEQPRLVLMTREQMFALRHKLKGFPWSTVEIEAVRALVASFEGASCTGEEQGTTTPPEQHGYTDAGR